MRPTILAQIGAGFDGRVVKARGACPREVERTAQRLMYADRRGLTVMLKFVTSFVVPLVITAFSASCSR